MDFDPVTGKLWDTENGPDYGDEINLVEPGFNSGWRMVQGMAGDGGPGEGAEDDLVTLPSMTGNENSLIGLFTKFLLELGGETGKYSDPEFVWSVPIGPTSLTFLDSSMLGKEYQNDMFVGNINNGSIFRFELDEQRTGFVLEEALADKVADNPTEGEDLIFASGFGGITDIQVGPDGYLYILSFHKSEGTIFRIVPNE